MNCHHPNMRHGAVQPPFHLTTPLKLCRLVLVFMEPERIHSEKRLLYV